MLGLVITLIVIGVLLWLLNTYGGAYIDGKILMIINVVVVICVVLYVLNAFGLFSGAHDIPVPKVR
jgi:hypothetical protein